MKTERGFIQFLPLLSLVKDNWKLIAIAAAAAAVVWYVWSCERTKEEFATFKAQVEAAGKAFEEQQKREADFRMWIGEKHEAENAIKFAALEERYRVALERARGLSRDNAGLEGRVRALSSAAASFDCRNGQADLAGRLERLEVGVLGLLERGDKAITRTVTCKGWLDEQLKVK